MIDKLIEKYKEKVEYNSKLDSVNCNIRETVYSEILKDLKELKKSVREELYGHDLSISEYKGACERLGVIIDDK